MCLKLQKVIYKLPLQFSQHSYLVFILDHTVSKWLVGYPEENPHSEVSYLSPPHVAFHFSWKANRIYTSNYYSYILIRNSYRLLYPKKGIFPRLHIYNSGGDLLLNACWKSLSKFQIMIPCFSFLAAIQYN